MKTCKCSMSIKLLGDGCEVCNPDLTAEISKDNMIEVLAEQNRQLRDGIALAIKDIRVYWDELNAADRLEVLLALPDISSSILNQRDARVLREAAGWFYDFGKKRESEPDIAAAQQLERMAAEKEKQ